MAGRAAPLSRRPRHTVHCGGEEIIMCVMRLRFGPLCGCPVFVVALLMVAATGPHVKAQFATAVAVTGQVAPDTGGNAFFTLGRPVIVSNGQVAFRGVVPGGQGIFLTQALTPSGNFPRLPATAAQNNLTESALSGAPANHTGLPPIYNNAAFYSVFDDKVALADNPRLGQIAFRATVNDGHLDGVFAVPPGNLSTQAAQAGLTQATVPP